MFIDFPIQIGNKVKGGTDDMKLIDIAMLAIAIAELVLRYKKMQKDQRESDDT